MRLAVYCKNCNHKSAVKSFAEDRTQLIMEKGEQFEIICKKCSHKSSYHVKDVKAIKPVVLNIFILLFGIYSSLHLSWYLFIKLENSFYLYMAMPIGIIPLGICLKYLYESNDSISRFS